MSVIVRPSEKLVFNGPFTRLTKESIFVKNPSDRPIVFKVKTTAPKQYCVRPNVGTIEANSELEVQIILQPFKKEPPEDYKCKDKFLVQTTFQNESLGPNMEEMWANLETTDKKSIHQYKILCVFAGPKNEALRTEEVETTAVVTNVPETLVNYPIPVILTESSLTPSLDELTPTVQRLRGAPKDSLPPVPTVDAMIREQLQAAIEKIKRLEIEIDQLKASRDQGIKVDILQSLDTIRHHFSQLENSLFFEDYPPHVFMAIFSLIFIFTYLFF
ncbi:unnamed protein product [Rhizopus stolonifer]